MKSIYKMACYNSNCYLPQPPRAWSRVQNSCSLTTDADNNGFVTFPYTNNVVPVSALGEKLAMLNKGNVLQYKANSSNLTAAQRYSKIAKGQWVNRNTTWATQTERGYTNPNTTSLKRSGNIVNIALDPITGAVIGPTTAPPTCTQQIIPTYIALPSNISGSSEPEIPPPIEPTPASETFPPIIPDTPIEPIVIQDGGSLICSVQENICTGEITRSVSQQLCNPTTASDVPGPIQELCWNDGTPTWYPRSRYIMTNSTNKWPVNAKLVSAVKPLPPVITSISTLNNTDATATLTWTYDSSCLPATRFVIFNNTTLVKMIDGDVFTTTIPITLCSTNSIYMFSQIGNLISDRSNVVDIFDTPNFTITGNYDIYFNSTHTIIQFTDFTNLETILFDNNQSVDIIAVGGGGGGGGGSNQQQGNPDFNAGGGGGGGGICFVPGYTLNANQMYTINVGKGGFGDSGNNPGNFSTNSGGNTTFEYNTNTIITSYGGGGGLGNYGNSLGAPGGTAVGPGTSTIYNSANGGNGEISNTSYIQTQPPANGLSISPSMPITSGGEIFYFSGGGGGGTYTTSPQYSGGDAGTNGNGAQYGQSGSTTGQNATTYGAGGGGAACSNVQGTATTGGNGQSGILVITFVTLPSCTSYNTSLHPLIIKPILERASY